MRFEPLEDRILVKADLPEEQRGMIFIPETYRRKEQIGTVIATSGGIRNSTGELVPPLVSEGDRILFGKYSGTEVRIDNDDYIIMKEADILGILHEGENQND